MLEGVETISGDKQALYDQALLQTKALLDGEKDSIANLANISGLLKQVFNFWWVGFYLVKGEELVLGPFQGPVACTRIRKGKGVCGTSWRDNQTISVSNVDEFPGHIACNADSKSEIVIPIHNKAGNVVAVLDVDSEKLNHFDMTDQENLERIVKILETEGILDA